MVEPSRRPRGARRSLLGGAALILVAVGLVTAAFVALSRSADERAAARREVERTLGTDDVAARAALDRALDGSPTSLAAGLLAAGGLSLGIAGGVLVAHRRRLRLRQALHPSMVAAADRKIERILAEHAQDLVTMVDTSGRFAYVSPSVAFVLGLEPIDLLGRRPQDVFGIDPVVDAGGLEDGEPLRHRARHADGRELWLETLVHHLEDDHATGPITLFSSRDISERVSLEQTLEAERRMLGDTLANVHAGILSVDLAGQVIDANAEYCSMVGFRPLPGTPLIAIEARYQMVDVAGEPVPEGERPMVRAVAGDTVKQFAATLTTDDGHQTEVVANAGPLVGSDGRRNGAVLTLHDVSELRAAEAELRTAASVDPLTGLANRRRLVEALSEALERNREVPERLALLFLDLDGFKKVNDTHGHDAGDQLLTAVAGRVAGCVRGGDTVARVGGDEFVIVVDHLTEPSAVLLLIQRIERALSAPFHVGGASVTIGASVGIAHATAESTVEELLTEADKAMYQRKRERAAGVASVASGAGHDPAGDPGADSLADVAG
jgi:diguanylate cyclase (GGDEF)-like protein/PAS domain S-box-containing protein